MSLVATEAPRLSSLIKHEYEPSVGFCRDVVTVYEAGAKTYPIGTVLGKTFVSSSVTATAGTNTGNGAIGTVTATGLAKNGIYTIRIVKAATNAGDFTVTDPSGAVTGYGTVAVAYSNQIAFTLADGATDFVVGDTFTVEVIGTYKHKLIEATATDGSRDFAAIYISASDGSFSTSTIAATTDTSVIALVNGAAVVGKSALTVGASVNTAGELARLYGQMEAKGIIARDQLGSFPVVA